MLISEEAFMPIFGYARVSTDGQTVAAQVADLRAAEADPAPAARGVGALGGRRDTDRHRPQLQCRCYHDRPPAIHWSVLIVTFDHVEHLPWNIKLSPERFRDFWKG